MRIVQEGRTEHDRIVKELSPQEAVDMNKTLKKIGGWIIKFFLSFIFLASVYFGTVENISGAQNIMYVYIGLGVTINTLLFLIVCMLPGKELEGFPKRIDFDKHYFRVTAVSACLVLFWYGFIWAGMFHLYNLLITQVCYLILADKRKKRELPLPPLCY
jgi:uncharacterized membrane protein